VFQRRLVGATIGVGLGLALGAGWWLVWGCRVCDPGGDPLAPLAMAAVVGAVLGAWLGGDRPPG
jgi:hypothetical protein